MIQYNGRWLVVKTLGIIDRANWVIAQRDVKPLIQVIQYFLILPDNLFNWENNDIVRIARGKMTGKAIMRFPKTNESCRIKIVFARLAFPPATHQ